MEKGESIVKQKSYYFITVFGQSSNTYVSHWGTKACLVEAETFLPVSKDAI